jgi:hypothetical protein
MRAHRPCDCARRDELPEQSLQELPASSTPTRPTSIDKSQAALTRLRLPEADGSSAGVPSCLHKHYCKDRTHVRHCA